MKLTRREVIFGAAAVAASAAGGGAQTRVACCCGGRPQAQALLGLQPDRTAQTWTKALEPFHLCSRRPPAKLSSVATSSDNFRQSPGFSCNVLGDEASCPWEPNHHTCCVHVVVASSLLAVADHHLRCGHCPIWASASTRGEAQRRHHGGGDTGPSSRMACPVPARLGSANPHDEKRVAAHLPTARGQPRAMAKGHCPKKALVPADWSIP